MRLFRTDTVLSPAARIALALTPFVLLVGLYLAGAAARHRTDAEDMIMPLPGQMLDGLRRAALERDREGDLRLWVDTRASALRFGVAIGLVFVGVILGLNMGMFPVWEALLYRFLVFFDKIPALSLLPILFIVFGLGELSKVALILLGVFPTVALDTFLRARSVPREMIYKAQTLGATEQEIAYRVVLPIIFPHVLDTIRLNFKSAMLLLIAGESLAATVGLGYRIFVVRRYVAMDIILPYVLWMTGLLFLADLAVQWWIRWRYPWAEK